RDEVRIAQIRPDEAPAEPFALLALHVLKLVVVEQDRDERDAVLSRGCELVRCVQKSAIAGDVHHRLVRMSHFHAECSRVPVTERALIAAVHVMPGLIHGEPVPRRVTDLSDLIYEIAVVRQRVANRTEIVHLRLHCLYLFRDTCFEIDELITTGWAA